MGIKQELLVLDGLLFLIFSGNFGFRLSALLVLQKKKTGIIRQIWASPEKRESKELPNPLGLGYSWEKGITGRGGMRMGTSDDHHEKTGNSHSGIPFFPNWDGKHGIPQGSAQLIQFQEKVGAKSIQFLQNRERGSVGSSRSREKQWNSRFSSLSRQEQGWNGAHEELGMSSHGILESWKETNFPAS